MRKRLILRLGVLLSSCLSAAAQTPTTDVVLIREPSAPLRMLVRRVPAQVPTAPVPRAAAETTRGRFTVLLTHVDSPDRGLKGMPPVIVVRTIFATQSRVPIVQLRGGWLQLDGFTSRYHMRSLVLGPLGLGHRDVGVPRTGRVYGICLSFMLGRDGQTERQAGGWRNLARAIGAGRDRSLEGRAPQLASSPRN